MLGLIYNPNHAKGFSGSDKRFIKNKGQIMVLNGNPLNDIKYYTEFGNLNIYLRKDGLDYVIKKVPNYDHSTRIMQGDFEAYRIKLRLLECNSNVIIRAEQKSLDYYNYYHAHCPGGINKVFSYEKLIYENIYNNIDLVYYTSENGFKYDFIIKPGGDVNDIKINYQGSEHVQVTNDGSLLISTPLGPIVENIPYSYLVYNSESREVQNNFPIKTSYQLNGDIVSFSTPKYDPEATLIIDPQVLWSTYYGGSDLEYGESIAADSDENVIILVNTRSSFMLTYDPIQTWSNGDLENFIVKFDKDGNRLWATFFGGSSADEGYGIASDSKGNIYISGQTLSTDFPTTSGAFQDTSVGYMESYIYKLDTAGKLVWSSYYGGSLLDYATDLTIDINEDILITGYTNSQDLPGSVSNYAGGQDGFVAKFDLNGSLKWSSYFGGTEDDHFKCVSTDNNGNIFVLGDTYSTDLPLNFGAYQSSNAGLSDLMMVKLNSSGGLISSSYYGGSGIDLAMEITVDTYGNSTFTGSTESNDFPVSGNAFQNTHGGGSEDAFLVKMGTTGNRLWATYIGGSGYEQGYDVKVDNNDNTIMVGSTRSSDLPVSKYAYQKTLKGSSDLMITKFNKNGTNVWLTYFGGSASDEAHDLVTDPANNIYITGHAGSTDFPVSAAAFQKFNQGSEDAFILKLDNCDVVYEPIMTVTGQLTFCDGDSVILTAQPGFDIYTWSNGDTNQTIIVKESGIFYVTVADSTGCSGSSDKMTTFNSPNPEPLIATSQSPIMCIGDTLELDAGGGYSPYKWSNGSTSRKINTWSVGSYYVEVTDINGCSGISDTINTKVNPIPVKPTITPNDSTQFCNGDSVILDAGSGYYIYTWSTGETSQSIIVRKIGNYIVTVSDTNSCSNSSKTEAVIVYPIIDIDTIGKTPFCYGDSVGLQVEPGYVSYEWSNGDTTNSIVTKQTGTYHITVGDSNNCTGFDTIFIRSVALPDAFAGEDTTICSGDSSKLFASGAYYFQWNDTTSLTCDTCPDPVAFPVTSMLYIVKVTDEFDCYSFDSVRVSVNSIPIVQISSGDTNIFCEDDSLILDVKMGFSSYSWNTGDSTKSIVIRSSGIYQVTVSDTNSCKAFQSIEIEMIKLPFVDLGPDTSICGTKKIKIKCADPNLNYNWSTGETTQEI
ncbi:SBBP repeat-containing protein, partial [bacterium AH-315-C07]|nr:SBBP repeat-containing protein [bacterium AH-315-C07]